MTTDVDATEPATVRIASTSHRIHVIAEHRADIAVGGRAARRDDGRLVTIDEVRSSLEIRVPVGTDLVVGCTSGRIRVSGPVGHVSATTQSSRIDIDGASSIDARTDSGSLRVERCEGECRIRSKSGRVDVTGCAGADVSTRSGRVTLRRVAGDVHAHCVSGRITMDIDGPHDVDAETVSGRITVSLPEGVNARRVTPGQEADVAGDYDCTINVRSISGRVDVANR